MAEPATEATQAPQTATTAAATSKSRPPAIDVSFAEYVEYESPAKGWTKRIENPLWIFNPSDGRPHHVIDKNGQTHLMPSWGDHVFFRFGQPKGAVLSDPNNIHLLF